MSKWRGDSAPQGYQRKVQFRDRARGKGSRARGIRGARGRGASGDYIASDYDSYYNGGYTLYDYATTASDGYEYSDAFRHTSESSYDPSQSRLLPSKFSTTTNPGASSSYLSFSHNKHTDALSAHPPSHNSRTRTSQTNPTKSVGGKPSQTLTTIPSAPLGQLLRGRSATPPRDLFEPSPTLSSEDVFANTLLKRRLSEVDLLDYSDNFHKKRANATTETNPRELEVSRFDRSTNTKITLDKTLEHPNKSVKNNYAPVEHPSMRASFISSPISFKNAASKHSTQFPEKRLEGITFHPHKSASQLVVDTQRKTAVASTSSITQGSKSLGTENEISFKIFRRQLPPTDLASLKPKVSLVSGPKLQNGIVKLVTPIASDDKTYPSSPFEPSTNVPTSPAKDLTAETAKKAISFQRPSEKTNSSKNGEYGTGLPDKGKVVDLAVGKVTSEVQSPSLKPVIGQNLTVEASQDDETGSAQSISNNSENSIVASANKANSPLHADNINVTGEESSKSKYIAGNKNSTIVNNSTSDQAPVTESKIKSSSIQATTYEPLDTKTLVSFASDEMYSSKDTANSIDSLQMHEKDSTATKESCKTCPKNAISSCDTEVFKQELVDFAPTKKQNVKVVMSGETKESAAATKLPEEGNEDQSRGKEQSEIESEESVEPSDSLNNKSAKDRVKKELEKPKDFGGMFDFEKHEQQSNNDSDNSSDEPNEDDGYKNSPSVSPHPEPSHSASALNEEHAEEMSSPFREHKDKNCASSSYLFAHSTSKTYSSNIPNNILPYLDLTSANSCISYRKDESVLKTFSIFKTQHLSTSQSRLNIFEFDHTMTSTLSPNPELYTDTTYSDIFSLTSKCLNWYNDILPLLESQPETFAGKISPPQCSPQRKKDLEKLSCYFDPQTFPGKSTNKLNYTWSQTLLMMVKNSCESQVYSNVLVIGRFIKNITKLKSDIAVLSKLGFRFHYVIYFPFKTYNNKQKSIMLTLLDEIYNARFAWSRMVSLIQIFSPLGRQIPDSKRGTLYYKNLTLTFFYTAKRCTYLTDPSTEVKHVYDAISKRRNKPLKLTISVCGAVFRLEMEGALVLSNYLQQIHFLPNAATTTNYVFNFTDIFITRAKLAAKTIHELTKQPLYEACIHRYGKVGKSLYAVQFVISTSNTVWENEAPIMIVARDKSISMATAKKFLPEMEWTVSDSKANLRFSYVSSTKLKITQP